MENAAYIGAVLSYFQDAPVDHAHFYRGDAAWMGLFDLQGQPYKTAYAFKPWAKCRTRRSGWRLRVRTHSASRRSRDVQRMATRFRSSSAITRVPAELQAACYADAPGPVESITPAPGLFQVKFLPPRTDIVYRNNAGYTLTIKILPWGAKAFSVKRYRISQTQNFELVEESPVREEVDYLSNPLAPEALELIVLRRR